VGKGGGHWKRRGRKGMKVRKRGFVPAPWEVTESGRSSKLAGKEGAQEKAKRRRRENSQDKRGGGERFMLTQVQGPGQKKGRQGNHILDR